MNAVARALDANSVPLSSVGGLAVADVATILFLVVLGELRHGVDVLGNPGRVLATAGPFLVGWLAAAPFVGAYSSRAVESSRAAILLASGTWLVGDLVGQLLRNTSLFPGNADPVFFLVMFLVGAVLLSVLRFASLVVADLTGN
jgi:hypothetical protein